MIGINLWVWHWSKPWTIVGLNRQRNWQVLLLATKCTLWFKWWSKLFLADFLQTATKFTRRMKKFSVFISVENINATAYSITNVRTHTRKSSEQISTQNIVFIYGKPDDQNFSFFEKRTPVLWLVTQPVVVISYISGQPIDPIFRGQESLSSSVRKPEATFFLFFLFWPLSSCSLQA